MSSMDLALEVLATMRRHNAVGIGHVRDDTGGVTFGRITYPSPPQQLPKGKPQRAAVVSDFSNGGIPCPPHSTSPTE
jgi:hypothetical protein